MGDGLVLVTGGGGFIGGALVLEKGARAWLP